VFGFKIFGENVFGLVSEKWNAFKTSGTRKTSQTSETSKTSNKSRLGNKTTNCKMYAVRVKTISDEKLYRISKLFV
jgi:hypothetical protein